MKKNKITVFEGHANFIGKKEIEIQGKTESKKIKGEKFIIASGARAREIDIAKVDGNNIWNYRHAMIQEQKPDNLVIIGSGAIGIEFMCFYASMGTKVTVLEVCDSILNGMDKELSSEAKKIFEKKYNADILTNVKIDKIESAKDGCSVYISQQGNKRTIQAQKILSAVGVIGNIENMGLERIGIKTDRGFIMTNDKFETSVEGIYALGDVTGGMCLAHRGSHEALNCIENIKNKNCKKNKLSKESIPLCVYSVPQLAGIGLSEQDAREKSKFVKVGRFRYANNGKAISAATEDGFVKIIADTETGEILGAHAIGADATEIIHICATAIALEGTYKDLQDVVLAHPTLSEMIGEAALDIDGISINQ